jgi:hypothetical protein
VSPHSRENASSNAIGIIVSVAITFVLAAMVLLITLQLPHLIEDPKVPAIFVITKIQHTNQYGVLTYESDMVVVNTGSIAYDNRKLYARLYRNGELLPCTIPAINFNEFVNKGHLGIRKIGGTGTNDFTWTPGGMVSIDYSKRTFGPKDTLQFEVYDRDTNQLISRDTYPHRDESNQEKMMQIYLSRQGA